MCAAKQELKENYINAAAVKLMLNITQQEEVSNSIEKLLGKRNPSDTTSVEKLRHETEDSREDDDDLESEEGDDGQKRERR